MTDPTIFRTVASQLQSVDRPASATDDILSEPEQDIVRKAERAGFERLGVGTERIVFALDDSTVIKIARPADNHRNGILANTREANQYTSGPQSLREILAPIHAVGEDNWCLTMERATFICGREAEIPQRFREHLAEHGFSYNDTLLWNVGYIPSKDRFGFIDFGCRFFAETTNDTIVDNA